VSRRRFKSPRFSATVAGQRSSRHAANRSRYPRLRFEIIEDDSAVLSLVDTLFEGNREHAKITRRILGAQQRLQALTGEDAWIAFLDIEQLVTERVNVMLAVTARWAFHEGRRSTRRGTR
jgi:hypothetical protein